SGGISNWDAEFSLQYEPTGNIKTPNQSNNKRIIRTTPPKMDKKDEKDKNDSIKNKKIIRKN
ncbi:MAG: hypothetical protein LBP87_11300, partial [Planctomycetaceae bacterium]|nr:hypothetical protein [Planctomycetaceae bacterium]